MALRRTAAGFLGCCFVRSQKFTPTELAYHHFELPLKALVIRAVLGDAGVHRKWNMIEGSLLFLAGTVWTDIGHSRGSQKAQ
jgi:hypothetical protein